MIVGLGSVSGAGPAELRDAVHHLALGSTLGTAILFAAREQHQDPVLITLPTPYPPRRVSCSAVAAVVEAPCHRLDLQAEQQRYPSEKRQDDEAQWWSEGQLSWQRQAPLSGVALLQTCGRQPTPLYLASCILGGVCCLFS